MQPSKARARGIDDDLINERIDKLKAFKRWVTHEVLPSIRKNGYYGKKPVTPSQQRIADKRAADREIRERYKQELIEEKARREAFNAKYPHSYPLLWALCEGDRITIENVLKKLCVKKNKRFIDRYNEKQDYQYSDIGVKMICEAVWEKQGRGESRISGMILSNPYLFTSQRDIAKVIWEDVI